MIPALDDVNAKIERASYHLVEFDRQAEPFERGAYTTEAVPDTDAGIFRLIAKDMGLGKPPVQMMLLAGEIAHQLRSALDHISFIFATEIPESGRSFPLVDTPKYESSCLPKIKGMSLEHQAIVESVQPYKHASDGRADTLWLLHHLNIIDKHRVIPACMIYPGHLDVRINGESHSVSLAWENINPQDGTELTSFPWPDLSANVEVKTSCEVAFEDVKGHKFIGVSRFFTAAICSVASVAERFSRHCE